jgi:hypothetical protein
MDKTGKMPG